MFWLEIAYLIGSLSFILGLKMLSNPDTAKRGNLYAGIGMGIAILGTILLHHNSEGQSIGNISWILLAMAVGTVIGYLLAMKVKMTAMPQMVSLFNGMGGACAAIISIVEYHGHHSQDFWLILVIYLGLVIGSISFAGSMVAYGKLDDRIKDIRANWLRILNLVILAVIVILVVMGVTDPGNSMFMWATLILALVYGVFFVMPIGGADMPVVISLLNSFTGMAAAFGGFLYSNQVMLTGGILVGSAGTILTILMCTAMNRSLLSVLVGSFGGGGTSGPRELGEQSVREIQGTDAAILCAYARRVAIIPGYGLAVAQAQHICHEFERILEEKGVEVYYAIHPVAGRMPGHMNVLLAEADVPYPKLLEMEEANDLMPQTDVAIIIGANDVVNPAAETDPGSPIYGMPIIQVTKADNVIVMKRSMGKGYAGIENELFFAPKTRMLFGDAKQSLSNLVSELKQI
ncbi:MAG: NAD(P)(+) transhydrogenase (Re/Si-specific) subunit beta [Saprospiraceae bacterium]|nr:NAD(P)(+) transhydrogenase (Re/Si-specific) subunit beta [Saprospiraceae bacterium]